MHFSEIASEALEWIDDNVSDGEDFAVFTILCFIATAAAVGLIALTIYFPLVGFGIITALVTPLILVILAKHRDQIFKRKDD